MNLARLGVQIASVLVLVTSCSGNDSAQPSEITNQAPETTAVSDRSDSSDVAEADQQEAAAQDGTEGTKGTEGTAGQGSSEDDNPELDIRPDLLTFPRGALFVSQLGLGSGSSGSALRIVDGDPKILTVSNDGREPAVLVYSLPAATTFERFAIPGIIDRPGNVTFFRDIVIEGSNVGPSSGFEVLVEAELSIPDDENAVAELLPEDRVPVRWLRLTLSEGIVVRPGDEGRTNLDFTELIGNGTQEPQSLSDAFDGRWELRLTERLDIRGDIIELHQTGATIFGCFGDIDIEGSVNGSIATANGINRETDQLSAFLFVEDAKGVIQAAASIDGSIFGARTAVEVADLDSTRCSGGAA